MKQNLILLTFVTVFLLNPATLRAQYMHPKVIGKQTTIRNVLVLPARVEIVKQGMRGPEGMAAESELLSTRVEQLVIESLATKQVAATRSQSTSSGEADAQKKYQLADIQSRYDAILPKIKKKPKDIKKARFSLGDEILNLNLDKSIDAVVFISGQGQKLTKGMKTFSILTMSLNLPFLALSVGIVDAHTGEVLVYTNPIAIADATGRNEQPLRKAIDESFKKLPVAP